MIYGDIWFIISFYKILNLGNTMRAKLYRLLETSYYDAFMMVVIIISIIPLAFKSTNVAWSIIDVISAIIFITDYIIRLITADYKLKDGVKSFIIYPFTPMAIIDLLSILPSISIFIMVNRGLRLLRIFRLIRTFRIFRVFKTFRYSKNIEIIINVFKKQKDALSVVLLLAVGYVVVCALVIFNVEPDTFPSFFDALYWATVSLTTVGYGDIYAVSVTGKVITMISAFFGIGVVALPAGIITAGYMEEINNKTN